MMRFTTLAVVAMLAGCGYTSPVGIMNRAIDKTVDSAANKVGERVGEAIAADILANNPHLMNAYAMGVFNVLFYQGGYYLDAGEYRVGEWSSWSSKGTAEADSYEKTLLRRHASGNEWWRVETQSTSNNETQVVVMEALFTGPDDTTGARRVLRMRAKLPNDEAPREIPITEENRSSWYISRSSKLTAESQDGMTVGEENIETPAGTFLAKHLQTKTADTLQYDWWLNDAVPGQMVKFRRTNPQDDDAGYEVNLIDFGTDRTESKLGVDLDKEVVEDTDAEVDSADAAE